MCLLYEWVRLLLMREKVDDHMNDHLKVVVTEVGLGSAQGLWVGAGG